ncbi:DUF4386 domain-containing protein [Prolixibacter denitrificans]|nr:DUF4386 domain-containing protein [Prolixibacter denitrificans]
MNLDKTTSQIVDSSQQKAAKIAGFMFLLAFIVPTLNWTLILSRFSIGTNASATANNILESELLFRLGMTIELLMPVGLIILGWTLYRILKPEGRNLALLALLLKLVEAIISAVIVLVVFIALHLLDGEAYLKVFTPEQLQVPLTLIIKSHMAIFSVPMVFLGLDMMIFSYLFFKSGYIPRILAAFGIFSFALIFIHSLMYLLAPQYAAMAINQIIFWFPSGLFELVVGFWLLFRGLNINHQEIYTSTSNIQI